MGVNKDQVRGRVRAAEGKLKEVAGKLVGSRRLRAKGKVQGAFGLAQAKFGDVKSALEKSVAKGR